VTGEDWYATNSQLIGTSELQSLLTDRLIDTALQLYITDFLLNLASDAAQRVEHLFNKYTFFKVNFLLAIYLCMQMAIHVVLGKHISSILTDKGVLLS